MACSSDAEDRKLSEIFSEGLTQYEKIESGNESGNSDKLQANVRKCIEVFEETTKLVNIGGIFSTNENIEEVATNNIKYLLLPSFLGFLTLRLQKPERILLLETAEVYFKDFLRRIRDYEVVGNISIKDDEEECEAGVVKKSLDLNEMARERNEKIRKYKEQKEIEENLKKIKNSLACSTDEELLREYFITYVKKQVNLVFDELKSIEQEKPLAIHMSKVKNGETFAESEIKDKVVRKPFQPIILTRTEVEKKVFGAGYPSLPTMTVQEFYDKRVSDGIFPAQGSYNKTLQDLSDPDVAKREEEKDEIKKEMDIESDDPVCLEKARNMDEFKDTHKRGYGNRMNRS